jgi:hypothetical protein
MASVVSTVAAGLETPDFLELRKTTTAPVRDEGGNRQLYSVLPEKQTSVRWRRSGRRWRLTVSAGRRIRVGGTLSSRARLSVTMNAVLLRACK